MCWCNAIDDYACFKCEYKKRSQAEKRKDLILDSIFKDNDIEAYFKLIIRELRIEKTTSREDYEDFYRAIGGKLG